MGKLYVGSVLRDTVGQLKIGNTDVLKGYVGDVLVFPQPVATTTSTTSTTTTPPPTTTTTSTSTTTTTAPSTTTTSTTTTTTTLGYNSFQLAYSATSGTEACSRYPTLFTNFYYTAPNISVLANGVTIYQNTSLTSPAGNGFYSNGINYWNTSAGAGNLQNQTSCSPATTSTSTTTTTRTTSTSTTTTTRTTSTTTTTTTAAPTTTSTTTTTTTAAPTTTTTTTSTTSTTTTAAPVYNISSTSADNACNGVPGCTDFKVTFTGTATLCLCTGFSVQSTSQACFDTEVDNNGTFWMSDGTNVRQFTRTGTNFAATSAGSCTSCGV
jgi:hypothetical protein